MGFLQDAGGPSDIDDLESLRSKYGQGIPLDSSMIPDHLKSRR